MRTNPFKIKDGDIRDRRLKRYNASRAEGDTFLFLPDFSSWLGKTLSVRNIVLYYSFIILLFVVLIGRASYLQLAQGDRYFAIAERNRLRTFSIHAPRGPILDRYQRPLVENTPRFYAMFVPSALSKETAVEDIIRLLQPYAAPNSDIEKIIALSRKDNRERTIIDDIPYDQALKLMVDAKTNPSIQITYQPRRLYTYGRLLSHVLGYVGKVTDDELAQSKDLQLTSTVGKTGLELQYDTFLRGIDGSISMETDAQGVEKEAVVRTEPQQGKSVLTTIDLDVQRKLSSIVESVLGRNGMKAAAVIVMDPNNGEVLGLVSYPSYDANLFIGRVPVDEYNALRDDPAKPLYARAIAGEYPAGSVFKPIVASAALQERLIDDSFTVMSNGGLWLGSRFFPDWRPGGHGVTNVYRALADSVNTFFYIIGGGSDTFEGLGISRLASYARSFGLGSLTSIDIPNESKGFVPDETWKRSIGEEWYRGDTYNVSIGQGSLTVTPLQVAAYTSYFANGGRPIAPHLVRSIDGTPVHVPASSIIASLRPEVIAEVRKGMRMTVTEGTATSMQQVPVPVAGKTGTAQFNRLKQPHSWFTAFAPYESPDVVVSVIVEEGGDRGFSVAIAREFLQWYFGAERIPSES